jgi:UMF1 family MFS transporter
VTTQTTERTYSKKAAWSWALYDAANSAFPLVITTAVFVLYFKNVVAGSASAGQSDFLWGISISVSALLVAVTSPFVGAAADARDNRKGFLAAYTAIGVLATAALGWSGPGTIAWSMTFFIIANAAFEGGMVFYGSLLPFVAKPESHGRWSGIGWASGYVGGLICLLGLRGFAENQQIELVTGGVAAWFALLSIPLFVNVQETARKATTNVQQTMRGLKKTFDIVVSTPALRRFFIAYFLYNDAIITVFSFSAPFATDELGYALSEVIALVLAVQITGAIGAFGFGFVADRIGNARTILITLAIWVFVTLAAFATAMDLPIWASDATASTGQAATAITGSDAPIDASELRKQVFFAVGLLVGFAMGATQSASRSFLASVIPQEMSARFFGFYAIAGRFSAVVGPFLFGLISLVTGSKAWSVLALALLFMTGFFLILGVDEQSLRQRLQSSSHEDS